MQFSICKYSYSFERINTKCTWIKVTYRCWSIWHTFIQCTQLQSDLTRRNLVDRSSRISPFVWMNNLPLEISFELYILLINRIKTVIKRKTGKHVLLLYLLRFLFGFFLLVTLQHISLKFINSSLH